MSDILDKILATKREEIAQGKQVLSEVQWLAKAARLEPTRGFAMAMKTAVAKGLPAVIAEVKRASPRVEIVPDAVRTNPSLKMLFLEYHKMLARQAVRPLRWLK